MLYAKIDQEGNVVEFPYNVGERDFPRQEITLPEDAVEVNTKVNLPKTTWDKRAVYNEVVFENEEYAMTYTVEDRFNSDEEKVKFLSDMKRVKLKQALNKLNSADKFLKSSYPEVEVSSWGEQVRQARLIIEESAEETPLIDSIASARGIERLELANKVITKSTEYQAAYGEVLGEYQRIENTLQLIDLEDETTWDLIDQVG